MSHRVFVVEDQISRLEIETAFDADAAGRGGEPALELSGLARTAADAEVQLEALAASPAGLPDAIVIDDYLPEHSDETEPQALELMRGIADLVRDRPRRTWPRTVLWSTCEPNLVYAFCALGGMQYQDKRHAGGRRIPVAAIWRALAGRRWEPQPFPDDEGLTPTHVAALPYVAQGLGEAEIRVRLGIDAGRPLQDFAAAVQKRDRTPKAGPLVPSNKTMAAHELARQGWVWVPFHLLDSVSWPAAAWVLPPVIDPVTHRERFSEVGAIPAEHRDEPGPLTAPHG